MLSGRPVRIPLRVLWRELRYRVLPPLVFGTASALIAVLWKSHIYLQAPLNQLGTAEAGSKAEATLSRDIIGPLSEGGEVRALTEFLYIRMPSRSD
jgi:hypothetical protein